MHTQYCDLHYMYRLNGCLALYSYVLLQWHLAAKIVIITLHSHCIINDASDLIDDAI